ncbi:MAG TPA: GNAT family N-acetyltransferase [Candidatus Limnocylindria bacterium]|nr:GNAT family N-acetyltransferase [Candidatus Limnocylindria bacterium]
MTTIRPADARDAAAIAGLTTQLGYPSTEDDIRRRLARLAEEGSATAVAVLVATDDADRPIGWIHLGVQVSLADEPAVDIRGLVVDDGARSTGIGADLLRAAEGWARERGLDRIVVRTRTTRERAHRFYEREGFTLTKTSRVYAKAL